MGHAAKQRLGGLEDWNSVSNDSIDLHARAPLPVYGGRGGPVSSGGKLFDGRLMRKPNALGLRGSESPVEGSSGADHASSSPHADGTPMPLILISPLRPPTAAASTAEQLTQTLVAAQWAAAMGGKLPVERSKSSLSTFHSLSSSESLSMTPNRSATTAAATRGMVSNRADPTFSGEAVVGSTMRTTVKRGKHFSASPEPGEIVPIPVRCNTDSKELVDVFVHHQQLEPQVLRTLQPGTQGMTAVEEEDSVAKLPPTRAVLESVAVAPSGGGGNQVYWQPDVRLEDMGGDGGRQQGSDALNARGSHHGGHTQGARHRPPYHVPVSGSRPAVARELSSVAGLGSLFNTKMVLEASSRAGGMGGYFHSPFTPSVVNSLRLKRNTFQNRRRNMPTPEPSATTAAHISKEPSHLATMASISRQTGAQFPFSTRRHDATAAVGVGDDERSSAAPGLRPPKGRPWGDAALLVAVGSMPAAKGLMPAVASLQTGVTHRRDGAHLFA